MNNTHPVEFGAYLKVWLALAVLTLVALGVGQLQLAKDLRAFLFVLITLAKVSLIAAIFMHLRLERMTLVVIVLIPLVFAAAMVFGILPDTHDSTTRFILSLR